MAGQKALLVGIDKYWRSEFLPLRGAVNDAVKVRGLLKRYFGFSNSDIRVLTNARATKRAIIHRLNHMVREAQGGDTLIFYFAGHGSQVRDRDGDERLTDFMDEVLCPYDMDWDEKTFILDDDVDDIFRQLRDGVLLEAFFDTCFWGASPRVLDAAPRPPGLRPDVRYLPPPPDIAARFEGEDDRLERHRFCHCPCFADRNALWAATQEGQTAAEEFFEGQVDGVFTYYGCRFIEQNIERLRRREYSRQELLQDLRDFLGSHSYTQVPELEASERLRATPPFRPSGAWEAWMPFGIEAVPERERVPSPDVDAEGSWSPFGLGVQTEEEGRKAAAEAATPATDRP